MFDNLEKSNEVEEAKPDHKTKYPNDEKILAEILEPNETINSQDSQGFTPLHRATKLGSAWSIRKKLQI